MTVHELMVALSEFPEDMRVVVEGYEGGLDDVTVGRVSIEPWGNGYPYEGVHGEEGGTPAVALLRDEESTPPEGTVAAQRRRERYA